MKSGYLVLLRKNDSPLGEMLDQAVARLDQRQAVWSDLPLAPQEAFLVQSLVLWDLHGFANSEVETLAAQLAPQRCGVVVLAPEVDDALRRLLVAVGALGLLVRPPSPAAVAAALEVAFDLRLKLARLVEERDKLQKAFEERDVIEQAKRRLMEARGVSESQALRSLQRYSRNHNLKLVRTASMILEGLDLLGEG